MECNTTGVNEGFHRDTSRGVFGSHCDLFLCEQRQQKTLVCTQTALIQFGPFHNGLHEASNASCGGLS